MKSLYINILFVFLTSLLAAQDQDTITLPEVSIEQSRLQELNGINHQTLDSLTMQLVESLTLSEALSSNSPLFIKSYGQGALATSSFRGTGASHTQVLWNGVNVNSPTLGQVDFALIPMSFVDKLTLLNGGNSIYSTSGGFGGSVHLNNTANWADTLSIRVNQSFSDILSSKTAISNNLILGKRLLLNTRVFYQYSKNQYTYLNNTYGKPPYREETQQNAAYVLSGIMEDIYLKINNNNTLTARFWAQQNFREIPRPLTVKDMGMSEEQNNDFIRTMLSWENKKANHRWLLRTAWMNEDYHYHNPISGVSMSNNTRLWSSHAAFKYFFSDKANLETGLNMDFFQVASSAYAQDFHRDHFSLFTSFLYTPWQSIKALFLLRAEKTDAHNIQLLPSASVEYELITDQKLVLKANASRNHHYPTMNDLFWSPGGNPNLDTESGLSYEAGIHYKRPVSRHKVTAKASATFFYSDIDNWILWQPDSVASYWTPSNLKNVVSQGIESHIQLDKQWTNAALRLNMQYQYTSTKNQTALYAGDASVNKQLIYVPMHTANATAFGRYKKWHMLYQYHYTGQRYTSSDNTRYMPDFNLSDLEIGYSVDWGKPQLTIALRANNMLNTPYQSVAWYPMPGRVLKLKIKLEWKK
ncbi:MAG: TonB-dependent receptor plug domain-containing protein [Bacteroidales bacterium]